MNSSIKLPIKSANNSFIPTPRNLDIDTESEYFLRKSFQEFSFMNKSQSAPNLEHAHYEANCKNHNIHFSNQKTNTQEADRHNRSCICRILYPVKGYIYGFIFTICVCISHIFIKMSTTLNTFNHMFIRYLLQLIVMTFFLISSGSQILGPKKQRLLLSLRGCTGFLSLICSFFSLQFLAVSDVEAILQCNSLITAILGRIFLREKITTCHFVSFILTITGVMLILRPTFVFGIEKEMEHIFHMNLTQFGHAANETNDSYKSLIGSNFERNVMGVTFVSMSAFLSSVSHITIKKLCLSKIHFSVISIYPVLYGLPVSILMSILYFIFQTKCQFVMKTWDIFYSFMAGSFATTGLMFLNKALAREDTAKISILRTSGVLFSFVFQYLILHVETDFLGIFGAVLIVFGTLAVLSTKLLNENVKANKWCHFFTLKI